MKGHFFSDPDHGDKENISKFCEFLKTHKEALGIKNVFLEFFYERVPVNDSQMEDDFAYCSGGRNAMARHYIGMVKVARELGLAVHGLSLPGYYGLSRQDAQGSMVFRTMYPFDGIASLIIRDKSAAEPFVVFLGSGHWPMLKDFLPTLTLVGVNEEQARNPWKGDAAEEVERLSGMIAQADTWTKGRYTQIFMHREVENQATINRLVSQLFKDRQQNASAATINQLYQDKVNIPLTLYQLNAVYAKLKNTLYLAA